METTKTTYAISGNTYPVKALLRSIGAKWILSGYWQITEDQLSAAAPICKRYGLKCEEQEPPTTAGTRRNWDND